MCKSKKPVLIEVNLLVDFDHGMFTQAAVVFVMETPPGANVAASISADSELLP